MNPQRNPMRIRKYEGQYYQWDWSWIPSNVALRMLAKGKAILTPFKNTPENKPTLTTV